jgi:hypothetical protein
MLVTYYDMESRSREEKVNSDSIESFEEAVNNGIDTKCTEDDFKTGDRVYAWWWQGSGRWFEATIKDISDRNGTFIIRFKGEKDSVSGYEPRLLRPVNMPWPQ